jgi:O-antigen/teichoic acid export membrane protein
VIAVDAEPPAPERTAAADGHHLAQGAAANALVLLAANFRGVFTFLIARLLGEAALGRFGVVFATMELLSKAGMVGLDGAIVPFVATRAAAGDRSGSREVFHKALAIALVASLTIAASATAVILAITSEEPLDVNSPYGIYGGGMVLMLLALPGVAVARISTGASRAVLSMRDEFYSRGVTETWVTTAVFLVAIALGARSAAPALAVVAGTTAAGIVAAVLASRSLRRVPSGAAVAHSPAAGEMLSFSTPIAGSSLLGVLVMRIDVLLLGAYVGQAPGVSVEAFGVFCAAAEIAGGMRKVRQVFDPIFAPIVATRSASVARQLLRETVAAPGRWLVAAQLPLVGVLLLAGGAVLSLYGESFRQGALWLALLALAHAANSFAGLVETLLMVERPHVNLVNAAVTVGLQTAAGLSLIPTFGATGAALAMLIGLGGQSILRFAELRHVFGWSWPWRSLKRPVVAFVASFAPALVIRVWWAGAGLPAEVAAAATFLGLYAVAWLRLGAEPADLEIWHRLRVARSSAPLDAAQPVTRQ